MLIAAIITPPDIFTLILVTIPIYGPYEVSFLVLKKWAKPIDPVVKDIENNEIKP